MLYLHVAHMYHLSLSPPPPHLPTSPYPSQCLTKPTSRSSNSSQPSKGSIHLTTSLFSVPRNLTNHSLCNSKSHSDLAICCGPSTFHAHQNILSLRTPFFTHAVSSFSEGADNNTVTLASHTPATVLRFLRWCYTGDYPLTVDEDDWGAYEGRTTHLQLYFLADYLGALQLQQLCAERYCQLEWQGTFELSEFMEAVRMVFENTIRREDLLREKILEIAVCRHKKIKAVKEYQDLLYEVDEFAASLALKLQK